MSKAVLYMSMSVDGFIAGPNEGPGNGLGDGGHRLHEWFLPGPGADRQGAAERLTGVNREVTDEAMATGAVVVGRRTFELAEGWGGDHHDGVPIFVLSRRQPAAGPQWPAVTYVSDIKRAMDLAREAAGGKDVLVHGAGTERPGVHRGAGHPRRHLRQAYL
ncbi:MAG: dihydrofolate reductase family protein [Gemmatimonadota bacterium]